MKHSMELALWGFEKLSLNGNFVSHNLLKHEHNHGEEGSPGEGLAQHDSKPSIVILVIPSRNTLAQN